MRILLVSPGELPVPAVKGGAVETLMDIFISENEKFKKFNIDCFTICERYNYRNFNNTHFIVSDLNRYISFADKMMYFWTDTICKDWRAVFRKNYFRKKKYMNDLKKLLSKRKYDRIVIENNMDILKTVYEAIGEKDFSRCCFYHMHSILVDKKNEPYLKKCRCIITVSNYVAEKLRTEYKDINNICVLKNCVNKSLFPNRRNNRSRQLIRQKLGISENERVFLYSGRLSVEKGVKELVSAYLQRSKSDERLVIAGGSFSGDSTVSSYEMSLRRMCSNVRNKVIFTGFVDNRKMFLLYNMADILVIPSIVEEAGPLTALEGIASGIPVVSADIGSLREYLGNYAEYAVVGDNFTDEISRAVDRALLRIDRMEHIVVTDYNENDYYFHFSDILKECGVPSKIF